jgi:hypothetical protein
VQGALFAVSSRKGLWCRRPTFCKACKANSGTGSNLGAKAGYQETSLPASKLPDRVRAHSLRDIMLGASV